MAEPAHADVPTVLGSDSNFKGEMTFDKGMRIHGRFEGKITSAGRLHIAKEARMQAEVEAGTIVVEGEIHGALTAGERVELKQSARYEGDLKASRMIVEEGAVFSGHVSVGPEAVKSHAAAPSNGKPGNGASASAPMPAALLR
jgi:cytoskeletal protein CcmA (bactofilin family)